jgi:uncharacterized membrane protein YdjX (TVP38/TMEM64 family)
MSEEIKPNQPKKNNLLKFLAMIAIATGLFIAFRYFNIQEYIRSALTWIDGLGTTGAIVFIMIYILATVLFIPGSLLTLGAGVLFGVVFGSLYVFIGATIGATAAFLVGRYLARGWVEKQIQGHQKFNAIDNAVGKDGLKMVLLLRLSPVFPFNLLNYALGITKVSLKDYFIGSIGMIPGTVMYVYIGSLAGDLATIGTQTQNSAPDWTSWAINITIGVTTIAIALYVIRLAKQALDSEIATVENSEDAIEKGE